MIRNTHRLAIAAVGFLLWCSVFNSGLAVANSTPMQALVTGEERNTLARQVLELAFASPDAAAKYCVDRPVGPLNPDKPCTVYFMNHELPGLILPTIPSIRFVTITPDQLKASGAQLTKWLSVNGFRPYRDGVLVTLTVCRRNGLIGAATVTTFLFRRVDARWEGELMLWPVPDTGDDPGASPN